MEESFHQRFQKLSSIFDKQHVQQHVEQNMDDAEVTQIPVYQKVQKVQQVEEVEKVEVEKVEVEKKPSPTLIHKIMGYQGNNINDYNNETIANAIVFIGIGAFFLFMLDVVCNILKNRFIQIIKFKDTQNLTTGPV